MPLTWSDIQLLRGERKTAMAVMHQQMAICEDFINASAVWKSRKMQRYLKGLPKGFQAQIPPIAKDAVGVGLDQVMVGETPSVRVLLPPGLHRDADAARKQVVELEKKLQALLWHIDTYTSESPLRGFMSHCLGLGLGVLAYPVVWDRWPDDPFKLDNGKRRKPKNAAERKKEAEWVEKRQGTIPWDVRALHPRRVLPDIFTDPFEDVIVEETVSLRVYGQRYPNLRVKPAGTGVLTTYCSPDYYGYWLDGQPVLDSSHGANEHGLARNTTGRLWYKFAWSGYGQQTYGGEWEYRGKGILTDARDVISMVISGVNQVEVMRGVYAFPPMEGTGPSKAEVDLELGDWEYGPATFATHSDTIHVSPLKVPEVPAVVLQSMEQAKGFLEVHFGPEILRGVFSPGDTKGGQAQRLGQAKAPLRPSKQGGQQAVAAMLMDICHGIKHELDGPVSLMGQNDIVTLGPDDIPDGIRILVEFAPPSPEEKAQELLEAAARVGQRMMSKRRYLEADPELEDVDQEQAEILSDVAMETQPVLDFIGQATVARAQAKLGAPAAAVAPEAAVAADPMAQEQMVEGDPNAGGMAPAPGDGGGYGAAPMGQP